MTSITPSGTGTNTTTMLAGRQADSQRRRQRVITALNRAAAAGDEISVSGIARAALFTEQGWEFQQFNG